jgi:hypothetical protein
MQGSGPCDPGSPSLCIDSKHMNTGALFRAEPVPAPNPPQTSCYLSPAPSWPRSFRLPRPRLPAVPPSPLPQGELPPPLVLTPTPALPPLPRPPVAGTGGSAPSNARPRPSPGRKGEGRRGGGGGERCTVGLDTGKESAGGLEVSRVKEPLTPFDEDGRVGAVAGSAVASDLDQPTVNNFFFPMQPSFHQTPHTRARHQLIIGASLLNAVDSPSPSRPRPYFPSPEPLSTAIAAPTAHLPFRP